MSGETDDFGQYASPPCFLHELQDGFAPTESDPQAAADIRRWRKAERERLIAARLAVPADIRAAHGQAIAAKLDALLGDLSGRLVGLYWPFRGEPDLRNWGIRVVERGGRIALPVVIQKGWPLEYRIWSPGDPLERGVWNIHVPARGPAVQPDIVVAPVVGFDEAGHRLGYGGGFFDRTLAAMPRRPLKVGVGYALARIATIYPQPHDIPMDVIVTD